MVIAGYLCMCLIFSTTFLAIKVGVDAGVPPFLSAGLRFFIAGLVLYSMMAVQGKVTGRLLLRKELLFTSIGLTFGTFATLYWAEQYVASGTAAILSATGPMAILIIQTFILKVKANRTSFIGCTAGLFGVCLLVIPSFRFQADFFSLIGSWLIVAGQIFYGSGAIYSKYVIKKFETVSPIALNAVQMMHGGILLLLLSLFTGDIYIEQINVRSVGSLLYLIVFGSMAGHTLFYWLVSKTNPVFPSTWLYVSPLLAIVLGAVFYGEPLSWQSGIGAVTIMIGTVLTQLDTLQSLYRRKQPA